MTKPETILKAEDIHKSFGRLEVLKGISLEARNHDVISILGSSGSGKSTFLRCLNFLEIPTSGKVTVHGEEILVKNGKPQNVRHIEDIRSRLGMLFQQFNLWTHRTALENVMEGPVQVKREPKADARDRAEALLKRVGLEDRMHMYPSQLSGGQQQRVALGRALITEPAVLLLDEPLSALDRFVRIHMRGELRRIQKQLDITFVHVTHSQEEALALADLVVVMEGGRIQQAGSPREVYDGARTPFVATFIGDHNVVKGKVVEQNAQLLTLKGEEHTKFVVPGSAAIGERVTFSVRADHAFIVPPTAGTTVEAAPNILSGVAAVVEYAGYQVRVKLETVAKQEFTLYVPEKEFSQRPIQLNQPLQVGWHPEDAVLLNLEAN